MRKQNFRLRHGSAMFGKISFSVSCSCTIIINISGSKRPWLMSKLCLLRFSISFPIKFDALTARKIIFKQHMKYVSVKLLFFKVD